MNHPSRYPECISQEDFALKYDIKIATLTFLVENITEEDLYHIKFFKLKFDENKIYYFREEDKIDKMLHLIIDENILKFSYLNKLQPDIEKRERDSQTIELLENISNDISDKLFDRNIKSSVKQFLPEYITVLYEKFQKESHTDKLIDKFKGLAFQNLISLNLDDFEKIKKKKT